VSYCLISNFKVGSLGVISIKSTTGAIGTVLPPKTLAVISYDIWTDGYFIKLIVTLRPLSASAYAGSRVIKEVTESKLYPLYGHYKIELLY
jgi:hypothetical protein